MTRAIPLVDYLICVSDDENFLVRIPGECSDECVLRRVGVLEFVEADIAVRPPITLRHQRKVGEQLVSHVEDGREIESVLPSGMLDIGLIGCGDRKSTRMNSSP